MKLGHFLYAVLCLTTVVAAKEYIRQHTGAKLEGGAENHRTLQQSGSSARATAIATAVASGDGQSAAEAIAEASADGDTEAIAEATAIAAVSFIHALSSLT